MNKINISYKYRRSVFQFPFRFVEKVSFSDIEVVILKV